MPSIMGPVFGAAFLIAFCGCATGIRTEVHGARAPASLSGRPPPSPLAYTHEIDPAVIVSLLNHGFAAFFTGAPSALHYPKEFSFGEAIAKRLKKIDLEVRKLMDLRGVPEPHFLISTNLSANAYVVPINVCVNVTATINGGEGGDVFPVLKINDFGSKPQTLFAAIDPHCMDVTERPEAGDSLNQLLAGKIQYGLNECQAVRTKDTIDFQCGEHVTPASAPNFHWVLQSPYVVLQVGVLTALSDWDEFDATIAHELGHYYLLHSQHSLEYGYHYDRAKKQDPFRPERSKDLDSVAELLTNMQKIGPGKGVEGYFKSPAGGDILNRLFQDVSLMIGDAKKFPFILNFAEGQCEKFGRVTEMDTTNFRELPGLELQVDGFLGNLRDCFQTVTYPGQNAGFYFSKFFRDSDRFTVNYFSPLAKDSLAENLWEAFLIADAAVTEGLSRTKTKKDFRRLGIYTYEQEADAFAIKYLAATKRGPGHLQSALVNMINHIRGPNPAPDKELDHCLNAFKRGWKTVGRPFVPIIKDAQITHHAFCYRLFNLSEMGKQIDSTQDSLRAPDDAAVPFSTIKASLPHN